jgi:hypothetical protein
MAASSRTRPIRNPIKKQAHKIKLINDPEPSSTATKCPLKIVDVDVRRKLNRDVHRKVSHPLVFQVSSDLG